MTRPVSAPPGWVPWTLCLGIALQAALAHAVLPLHAPAACRGYLEPQPCDVHPISRATAEFPSDAELSAARGTRIDHTARGYRLLQIPEGSFLESLAFRRGDLVTSWAGVALDSSAAILTAAHKSLESPSFSVEFERGGQPNTRTFEWY